MAEGFPKYTVKIRSCSWMNSQMQKEILRKKTGGERGVLYDINDQILAKDFPVFTFKVFPQ